MFYEYGTLALRVLLAYLCAIARDLFSLCIFLLSFGMYPSEPIWSLVLYIGIKKQWIEEQMKRTSSIARQAKVQSVRLSSVANRGQSASAHIQLEVTVVLDRSNITKKFILKRSERTLYGRFMNLLRTEYREAYVYQENIIGRIPEMRIPHILFTRYSSFFIEHDVVMEDMRDRDGFFGLDLLGGLCHKPLYSKHDQRLFLELLATLLANFHSRNWNSIDLVLKNQTLCWSNWYAMIQGVGNVPQSTLQSQYVFSINFAKSHWQRAKVLIDENKRFWEGKISATPYHPHISSNKRVGNFPLNISPLVVSFIEESLQRSTPSAFIQSLSSRPFTLSHGDFHADNIYILPVANNSVSNITKNDIMYFDLSEVGFHSPEFDLSNLFFINIVNSPEYNPHEVVDLIQTTLRIYYNVLQQTNVSLDSYSFEECFDGFVLSALQRYCWVFPIIATKIDRLYLTQYLHDGILFYLKYLFKNKDKFLPAKPLIQC